MAVIPFRHNRVHRGTDHDPAARGQTSPEQVGGDFCVRSLSGACLSWKVYRRIGWHPPDHKLQLNGGSYVFSGHVHPGITLKGKGKQALHFPCFYFTSHHGILPAFSRFTGTYPVAPQKNEKVFAVVEREIVPLSSARTY